MDEIARKKRFLEDETANSGRFTRKVESSEWVLGVGAVGSTQCSIGSATCE